MTSSEMQTARKELQDTSIQTEKDLLSRASPHPIQYQKQFYFHPRVVLHKKQFFMMKGESRSIIELIPCD